MRILFFIMIILIGGMGSAMAGETVIYKDGAIVLEGYLAKPAGTAAAPVVMIVHQWMGLGANEKMRADMLAAQGYQAFAVDMYGQGVRPKNQQEAGALATKYKSDSKLARKRIMAAYTYAKNLPNTTGKIAIIGYCFGGTMALELARSGAPLDGVVSFHGGLATNEPAARGSIKEPLQIHHGAIDPLVTPDEVAGFMKEMLTADARVEFYSYPDAVHAFTQKEAGSNIASGIAYNEAADKASWPRAIEFLAKMLK